MSNSLELSSSDDSSDKEILMIYLITSILVIAWIKNNNWGTLKFKTHINLTNLSLSFHKYLTVE